MYSVKEKICNALNGFGRENSIEVKKKLGELKSIQELYDFSKKYFDEQGIKFYLAYGSNMDFNQMDWRCPNSLYFDKVKLNGYRFVLDEAGVASIIEDCNSSVECVVWLCPEDDVDVLDRYEGVRYGCYRKSYIDVEIDGAIVNMLVYFSNREICYDSYDSRDVRSGYMELIIDAAERLSFERKYIDELKRWRMS